MKCFRSAGSDDSRYCQILQDINIHILVFTFFTSNWLWKNVIYARTGTALGLFIAQLIFKLNYKKNRNLRPHLKFATV